MIRAAGGEPVTSAEGAALVVVDLTEEGVDPAAALAAAREGSDLPALAYYAHTDDAIRRAALDAGFAKVVPRSRMMREGVELIKELAR